MSQSFGEEGFNPNNPSDDVRQLHLFDDVDQSPEAHHHTIGTGPDQAISYPLAKNLFDNLYAAGNHSHPELAGDNLIVNGDAASGDVYWTRTHVSASSSISANKFITILSANPSSCNWKSEPFIPVVNETVVGSITYQASQTTVTIQVDVLWNTTGALPDDGDGISTTVTLLSTTVDAISLNEVSTLEWVVPASCAAARLIVRVGNGSLTSGFPINVIFDNVQLISKLRDVSPLYVGVTGPQTMEGSLTITSPFPLTLPDGAVDGYVLKTDAAGQVYWADGTDPVEFSDSWTKPAGVTEAGELWLNTERPQDTAMFLSFEGNGVDKLISSASPNYAHISDCGSCYFTIPYDGVVEITGQLWVGWTDPAAGAYSQGFIEVVLDSGTATVDYGAQDYWFTTIGGAAFTGTRFQKVTLTRVIRLKTVGVDGATLRLRYHGLYATTVGKVRWERVYVKYFPNAAHRKVAAY